MNDVDIVAQAARIRDHRFTGYTNAMLADEIELMRSGQGVSGLSEAVAALKAVARALEDTDDTLRTQLAGLGIEWESDAGREAASAVHSEADFSREAGEKVNDSAERVFAQGEAFNRAVHSLPDPAVLRAPVPEPGIADFAFSLLGFESDHVRRLEQSLEAREQAIQALDTYARQSGENLLGVPELGPPERLVAKVPERVPESIDAGGGPRGATSAANASAVPVSPGPTASGPSAATSSTPSPSSAPVGVVTPSSVAASSPEAPSSGRATGSGGRFVAQPSPAPSPSGTTPSGAAPPSAGTVVPPAAAAGAAGVVGAGRGTDSPRVRQGAAGQAVPGASGGQDTGGAGRSARPTPVGGGSPGAVGAAPHSGGGAVGRPAPAPLDAQLARGLTSGAVAPTPSPASGGSADDTPRSTRDGLSVNDIGGGIAALGAGGVAGALSSAERSGRGVGRSAPGAQVSPRPLSVGDLPEEEARVQRSSERLNPGASTRRDTFLEKAVPGEGEEGEHVRRFAVEDDDLFTDQRMVAPDVIGDDGSDGRL
ncbi:PPE domain-containing protein [Saccharomonospora cyanea]|uniref:Mg chelatase, cobalamin biosynthesis protein CobN n=1 Tax=Saccharomonospora cyanea NA-134 TaxID=882082 RepID=H5XPA2_9PSEU|nr:PPE domain-containing protein [Saccharomonospora cyanea]EHR63815.1 Mg chelatase, cobalamin biosynthesis protein CobN [Saccharomonospora cyanea NA-134]